MKLGCIPQQVQVLECPVCGQFIDNPNDMKRALEVRPSGRWTRYADCPCCRQRVTSCKDRAYQARARRWIKKIKAEAEAAIRRRQALGELLYEIQMDKKARKRQVVRELLDGLSTKARIPAPKKPK